MTLLTNSTCCKTNAKNQRLLEDEHEHCGDDKRAIATLRIEDRNILEIERTGQYLFLAHGVLA